MTEQNITTIINLSKIFLVYPAVRTIKVRLRAEKGLVPDGLLLSSLIPNTIIQTGITSREGGRRRQTNFGFVTYF